jgi:hypothetical protein
VHSDASRAPCVRAFSAEVGMRAVRGGTQKIVAVALGAAALAFGCEAALTRGEAAEALEEAAIGSEAMSLVGGSVEIYTDFTIGGAVEAAAEELRTFVETQLPCAEVTVSGATLAIEYGARPGTCTYRGQTYAGTHSVTIMRNQMDDVVVTHTWDALRNERVSVTGSAMVTWSFADRTRHVAHELTWTRLSDGRTGVGSGDRTQAALEGGIVEGFRESGERTWEGESGTWTLTIDDVQMRWVDPCPQAGRYVLDTPFEKQATLAFDRVDEDTIHVEISSGARSYGFDVSRLGTTDSE